MDGRQKKVNKSAQQHNKVSRQEVLLYAPLTRSPQLPDIQRIHSYKLPNWFLDQSHLYIRLEPPIKTKGLNNEYGIPSLPLIPIYRNSLSQGHEVKSSRNESPLFPKPLQPLHIDLQSERYREFLTPAEASFLEQIENYRSPSFLEDISSGHKLYQVKCRFPVTFQLVCC